MTISRIRGGLVRNLAIATVLGGSLAGIPAANAAIFQLGFMLDRSGSIGSTDWGIITSGLSSAILAEIPVVGPNQYEISVVSFSDSASIDVNAVLVDSAATRTSVANTISSIVFTGGTTNMSAAFSAMETALTGSANFNSAAGSSVNLATDGQPNSDAATVTARNSIITAGIDNISIEAIGSGVDATFLQNSICYPGPCDLTAPYNFPAQGFYIALNSADDYGVAIAKKIETVVESVPTPGSLALMGIGLAGIGLRRRGRSAKQG